MPTTYYSHMLRGGRGLELVGSGKWKYPDVFVLVQCGI